MVWLEYLVFCGCVNPPASPHAHVCLGRVIFTYFDEMVRLNYHYYSCYSSYRKLLFRPRKIINVNFNMYDEIIVSQLYMLSSKPRKLTINSCNK